MERRAFNHAVGTLLEAAPTDGLNPLFSNVWFDGQTAFSYDGVVALKYDIETPIEGGVPGKVLASWLGKCRGKSVSVSVDDGVALFKCGRANIKLPVSSLEERLFDWADIELPKVSWDDGRFVEALHDVSDSTADMVSSPEYAGVIAMTHSKKCWVLATNQYTVRITEVNKISGGDRHLPYRFAVISRNAERVGHTPGGNHVAELTNGAWVVCQSMDVDHKGKQLLNRTLKDTASFPVPRRMLPAVERIVATHRFVDREQRRVTIKSGNGKLLVKSETSLGNTTESLICERAEPFVATVHSDMLLNVLGDAPHTMAYHNKGVYFYSDKITSLLSAPA